MQFSAEDEGIADAVKHAAVVDLATGVRLRVAAVADLIVLKLAAAVDPARRPSKREHDIADVLALGVSAALAASIFHDGLHTVEEVKDACRARDLPMR